MTKRLKFLRILITCMLLLLLTVNLYLIGARVLLGAPQPKLFGYSHSIVLSGSMEPVFSAGDMLVYRVQPAYQVGDIVLFEQNGTFVTHRIIRETPDGFITRGDANNTEDREPVTPDQIHGAMVLVIPRVGSGILFLRTPLGLLFLISTGLLLWNLEKLRKDPAVPCHSERSEESHRVHPETAENEILRR